MKLYQSLQKWSEIQPADPVGTQDFSKDNSILKEVAPLLLYTTHVPNTESSLRDITSVGNAMCCEVVIFLEGTPLVKLYLHARPIMRSEAKMEDRDKELVTLLYLPM